MAFGLIARSPKSLDLNPSPRTRLNSGASPIARSGVLKMAGQRGEEESGDGQSLAGLLPRSWPILSEEFNTPIHRFGPASHQIMPLAFIDMERYIFIQSL